MIKLIKYIRNKIQNKICFGCENIKNRSFPFILMNKSYRIDTEGQGNSLSLDEDGYLKIFHCPVCGKKLTKIHD